MTDEGPTANSEWMARLRAEGISKKQRATKAPEPPPVPLVPLSSRLIWVASAFISLSRTRVVLETGPQPINFSDMKAYCELEGIFLEEDLRDLVYYITEMDIVYLKHTHLKIQTGREKAAEEAKRKQERAQSARRNR
jgi:hypothetical protein